MAELPHRDIYVGMVAEDLAKDGYFGEEVYRYFYLERKEKEPALREFEDETSCVISLLEDIKNTKEVTDYVMLRQRIYDNEDREAIFTEIRKTAWEKLQLQNNLQIKVGANIYSSNDCVIPKPGTIVDNEKIISGFLWENGSGNLQKYSNAYLPSTWRKWLEKQKQGICVSQILCEVYTIDNLHPLSDALQKFKEKIS